MAKGKNSKKKVIPDPNEKFKLTFTFSRFEIESLGDREKLRAFVYSIVDAIVWQPEKVKEN